MRILCRGMLFLKHVSYQSNPFCVLYLRGLARGIFNMYKYSSITYGTASVFRFEVISLTFTLPSYGAPAAAVGRMPVGIYRNTHLVPACCLGVGCAGSEPFDSAQQAAVQHKLESAVAHFFVASHIQRRCMPLGCHSATQIV